jgi:membrane-bound lytic murein transglycosylase D
VAFNFLEAILSCCHTIDRCLKATGLISVLLAAACGGATAKQAKVATPAPPIKVPGYIEPLPATIDSNLPAKTAPDDVDLDIADARMRFDRGDELYRSGSMKRAKEEFDSGIDLLLESSAQHPHNDRLARVLDDIVAHVHGLELAAIHDGDGFNDQPEEHAAIDDLQQTFPSPIDPKLKKSVEEDIQKTAHDLPIELNDRVLGFLEYYQNGRGHSTIMVGLQRMGKYRPMIERILGEEGVPLDLIYLCQAESAFLPRALSRAQAKGMWQFISARGKEYGLRQSYWVDERSDPEKSTRAAARHLKDLYEEFGDWNLAMAAYNAGPLRISRAMERSGATTFWELADKRLLPRETISYVPTILALTIIGNNPEKYGFTISPEEPLEIERVSVDKATDLRVIAQTIDLPLDQLRELNSHVLRWTTPPDDPDFELILPKGYADKFEQEMAALPDNQRVLWRHHTVTKGQTLAGIAKKYGLTTTAIAQANNISPKKSLVAGQSLLIPLSGGTPAGLSAQKEKPQQTGSVRKTSSQTATYTVRRGDTLAQIAAKFSVTISNLKRWNHLTSNKVAVGRRLLVNQQTTSNRPANNEPHKVLHQVRQGETLNKIASQYGTTVDAIRSWNKTNDLSVIRPGDRITIFVASNE